MSNKKPTYQEMEERLADAEALIAALRNQEVDAIITMRNVALLRAKEAEEALRVSEKRYRALFDESKDAILITTQDGKVAHANRAAFDLFGYTEEEFIGLEVREAYVNPDDRHRFQDEIEQKGSVRDFELRLRKKDGAEMDCVLSSTVRRAEEGNILGYQGIIRDVTERKRAEERLRKYRDHLEQLVEKRTAELTKINEQLRREVTERRRAEKALCRKEQGLAEAQRIAHFGNWDWNIATNEVLWSQEIYRIFGLQPQEFGATYDAFLASVHPDDRESFKEAVNSALADPNVRYEIEHRVVRPDGSERVVHEGGEITFDDGGKPIRMIGTIHDITERKLAEEEAGRLREELNHVARVATMGELAASLAHELNQPLAAIVTNAQAAQRFLAGDKPDFDEVRDGLTDIVQDGRRAGEVIRRIRALLKTGDLEKEPLDINEIIQEIVSLLHSEAVVKNISMRLDLATDLPPVLGDRIQLQQVILNLLLNGMEAMRDVEAGSRELLVRTSRGEPTTIDVVVQDSGIGLDEGNMNRIFAPFFTTKTDGLGMGLSISRSIIQAHGGRLRATNNPERGATFHFTLPADKGGSV